ncbi:MAG: S1 RNA-binding domain-containing protein, partial [Betaproteobacteria bacterium]|nr:S1 RNA-binding domain-containing protein [Betaproteobacteria bacterium]
ELEPGIEGLVHVSEMDWTNKNVAPSKIVSLGDEVEVMVLEIDEDKRRISLGMKQCKANPWQEFAQNTKRGDRVKGPIKSITDFGVFVGLAAGIDGLLHITDMAWRRVRHPSEVVTAGQEITAKILKFDTEKNRVSLGLKQMGDDPWMGVNRRYPQGTRMHGKVTNIADYGAFVELEPGIEGLVHVSEMDWTNKNVAPSKIVALGDEVEVMVLEIDEDKRRISLGMKQCKANPWQEFASATKRGDKVTGPIKSITDFGVFVGLAAGIDGLVHLSDLSWNETGEVAVRNFKKGQEVEAVVLAVDVERERISLGIKQLDSDPFTNFVSVNDKGQTVTGTVKTVDAKGAEIDLGEDIIGYLRVSEISRDRVEDASHVLKVGDEVSAVVINIDRKTRNIQLSIKAKDAADQADAMANLSQQSAGNAGTTSLGALLRAKLDNNEK